MSATQTRLARAEATALAWELVALLAPYCERLEVLGSLRRQRPDCGDIELLAIPKTQTEITTDLFGEAVDQRLTSLLEHQIAAMLADGSLRKREPIRWGSKYKAAMYRDFPVDLFICHPTRCIRCGILMSTWNGVRHENLHRVSAGLREQEAPGTAGVREGLRSNARLGNAGCKGQGEGAAASDHHLRDLRKNSTGHDLYQDENLQPGVRREATQPGPHAEEPEVDGVRPGNHLEGGAQGRGRLHQDLSTSTPERQDEGGRLRASGSGGAAYRPIPGVVGESPSPQRGQGRQPDRESGDRDPGATERRGDLSPLQEELPGSLACRDGAPHKWEGSQWGVLSIIRTGSNGFAKRLVTPVEKGGWMPAGRWIVDGALWRWRRAGIEPEAIATPEEIDVFCAINRDYIPPELREVP